MNENDGAKMKALTNLYFSSKEVLSDEDFAKINNAYWSLVDNLLLHDKHGVKITGSWAVNQLLVKLHKTTSKKNLKKILEGWDSNFIDGHEDQIFNGSAVQTIKNYHNFLRQMGYINGEDIRVEDYGNGFLIEMVSGCPYGPFCEKTGNVKCVRKTNIEHIIDQRYDSSEFILRLHRPKEGHNCIIKGIPLLEAGDEMRRSNDEDIVIL